MRLSIDMVQHVAELAHIWVDPEELPGMAKELDQILDYVARLDAVDTTAVDPGWHPPTGRMGRPDQVADSLPRDRALANAPRARDGMFVIPRILGEGEEGQ